MPVWTWKKHLHEEGGVGMFELIVIWSTGDKNVYEYDTQEEAVIGAGRMRMAFGKQITWTGVRKSTL